MSLANGFLKMFLQFKDHWFASYVGIFTTLEYQIIVVHHISAWWLTIFLLYYIKLQDFGHFCAILGTK